MSLETFFAFVVLETLLCLSPGPAVILVVGLAARFGMRTSIGAIIGILAANTVYFVLASVGVGAVILASSALFSAIKWMGAAYLVWLGVNILVPLVRRHAGGSGHASIATRLQGVDEPPRRSPARPSTGFVQGFALQAANPKSIVFFVAILPQFVSPEGDFAIQIAILGVASVLIECAVLLLYSVVAGVGARRASPRIVDTIDGLSGGALVAMGMALAVYRRAE